jgi:hypothetical protein
VSIGDGISGIGATRYRWVPAVRHEVQLVLSRFPQLRANTYICHPWCGWGRFSFDLWGEGGRGDPAPYHLLAASRRFLLNRPGPPLIRHTILEHTLWTSFGGESLWVPDDHSGALRHLHVTYWRT